MKSNYNQLGQYIEMVSRTNSDLKYGIEDVRGCSNTKQMMQTRANLIGRTYEKFIVLRPQEFVFNRRTTRNGEKIGMAYNNTDREYIFTNDYVAFRVKQEYLDKLLPDYLYMFFCRDEFDRYARYKSTGSATEFFNWEDMCAVPFEIPPMDFQQLVVNAYKVLNERIETKQKINDNLEAQAYSIYKEAIAFHEKNSKLSDIAQITMGTSPEGESFNSDGNGIVFYQGRTDFGFRFPTVRLYTTEPKRYADEGDILMSVRAPVGDINIAKEYCAIGRGLASIKPNNKCYSYLYYTMMNLNFELKKFNDEGTVFGSITKNDLFDLEVVVLSDDETLTFEREVSIIDKAILNNEIEIQKMQEMTSLLLSKLTD